MKQDRKCSICGFIAFANQLQERTKENHRKTHGDEKIIWEAVW